MRDGIAVWFVFAAVVVAPTCEADGRVALHLATEHAGGGEYVETNPGVAVEIDDTWCDDRGAKLVAGAYRNSIGAPSPYAQCVWPLTGDEVRLTGGLGGVLGYVDSRRAGPLGSLPLATVNLSWRRYELQPILTYTPTSQGGVVLFSVAREWR